MLVVGHSQDVQAPRRPGVAAVLHMMVVDTQLVGDHILVAGAHRVIRRAEDIGGGNAQHGQRHTDQVSERLQAHPPLAVPCRQLLPGSLPVEGS